MYNTISVLFLLIILQLFFLLVREVYFAQILNFNDFRTYLVKQLCRSYGIDVYQTICRNPAPFLRWISIKDMKREQVICNKLSFITKTHLKMKQLLENGV